MKRAIAVESWKITYLTVLKRGLWHLSSTERLSAILSPMHVGIQDNKKPIHRRSDSQTLNLGHGFSFVISLIWPSLPQQPPGGRIPKEQSPKILLRLGCICCSETRLNVLRKSAPTFISDFWDWAQPHSVWVSLLLRSTGDAAKLICSIESRLREGCPDFSHVTGDGQLQRRPEMGLVHPNRSTCSLFSHSRRVYSHLGSHLWRAKLFKILYAWYHVYKIFWTGMIANDRHTPSSPITLLALASSLRLGSLHSHVLLLFPRLFPAVFFGRISRAGFLCYETQHFTSPWELLVSILLSQFVFRGNLWIAKMHVKTTICQAEWIEAEYSRIVWLPLRVWDGFCQLDETRLRRHAVRAHAWQRNLTVL